ncbi:hypothetical protein Dda_1528 [Drechslerella dactyloides]|uniref:Uncharacterized protein n=1 Tax=Drechslerella dactyloides TaxID=74499 RepID=A0AAD6J267_DREDA|nr:hypothetical protein Dda_1528 [Drechslerella dactyloides]
MLQTLLTAADTFVSVGLIFVAFAALFTLAPESRSSGPARTPPPAPAPALAAQSPSTAVSATAARLAMSFARDKRFVLTNGAIALRKTTMSPSPVVAGLKPPWGRRQLVGVSAASDAVRTSRSGGCSADGSSRQISSARSEPPLAVGAAGPSEGSLSRCGADAASLRFAWDPAVRFRGAAGGSEGGSAASSAEARVQRYLADVSVGQRAAWWRDRARRRAAAASSGRHSRIPMLVRS